MNEYINITLANIDQEHLCCAIGDPKHREGVNQKKAWIKSKLKDGHVSKMQEAKYLLSMNRLRPHGFPFMEKTMNTFIVYGLPELIREKESEKNY